MPLYEYACKSCGHADSEFQHMTSEPLSVCPACKRSTYEKQVSRPHSTMIEFHKPIELYSVAVQDLEEIRRLQVACPDMDISDNEDDPMYGVPIARSRHAKMQILKACGFRETEKQAKY